MTARIRSGQEVARFALPLPLDALSQINELIERIYGTGDTMLRPAGHTLAIVAPLDGFGPRVEPATTDVGTEQSEDGQLTRFAATDDGYEMTFEHGEQIAAAIAQNLAAYLDQHSAINYVEARLGEGGYIINVRRPDGKTPAALRDEAEERAAKAEAELESARAEIAQLRG